MKKSIFLYIMVTGTLMAGCSKDEPKDTGTRIAIESIEAVSGMMAEVTFTRADFDDDPTAADGATRFEAGQVLTVRIGTVEAEYKYQGGKWIPAVTGSPVYFPGSDKYDVEFTLSAAGAVFQDGTAGKLIAADALYVKKTEVSASSNLTGIVMPHASSLLEFSIDSSIDLLNVSNVVIGHQNAYQSATETWQIIAGIGESKITVSLDYFGLTYTAEVAAGATTADLFTANSKYEIPLSIENNKLVCGKAIIRNWDEKGAEGTAGYNQTVLDFTGSDPVFEGKEFTVTYSGGSTGSFTVSDGKGILSDLGKMGLTIVTITDKATDGIPPISINRNVGETIELSLNADGTPKN